MVTLFSWMGWVCRRTPLTEEDGAGSEPQEEVFDVVVVCIGHFTEPRVAAIIGN